MSAAGYPGGYIPGMPPGMTAAQVAAVHGMPVPGLPGGYPPGMRLPAGYEHAMRGLPPQLQQQQQGHPAQQIGAAAVPGKP